MYFSNIISYLYELSLFCLQSLSFLLTFTESQVIQFSLEDVKLKYCYGGFFACVIDFRNWFGGTSEVSGNMTVLAYVINTGKGNGSISEEPSYKIGSCTHNYPFSMAIYFVMIGVFRLQF
jgi:hypothetical protein